MADFSYYIFCAMLLGGALVVLLSRGYVNAAMGMLCSMLGAAGLMVLMQCYFLAFVMVSVYAGSVLVLFVFVVMLIGDVKENSSIWRKIGIVGLWVVLGAFVGWVSPMLSQAAAGLSKTTEVVFLSQAKNYGLVLVTEFMLPFQIAGALLLAAMIGVMVVAKNPSRKKARRELV